MNKNFHVGQSNELVKDGCVYDLHNCFDFESITILGDRRLLISFKPNLVYGVEQSRIVIEVHDLDYLEASPQFGTEVVYDLDEIGYKSPQDRDDLWLLNEAQSSEDAHLFFRFIEGHFIRFHGSVVTLCEASFTP